jgi:hypothetical protein
MNKILDVYMRKKEVTIGILFYYDKIKLPISSVLIFIDGNNTIFKLYLHNSKLYLYRKYINDTYDISIVEFR